MNACPTGKRGYPSPHAGRLANTRNSKRLTWYQCPDCGQYHTSNLAAEGRAKRRRAS